MPRRARQYIAGYPYHIVQRGNNKQLCFFKPADYFKYLDLLKIQASKYQVSVHAYCLMSNHVHFLLTPADETGISNVMKVVGSSYAQYINRAYSRTGTMWEGRHRPSLIQTERYLLACYRYIEMNPVRAAMVEKPGDYAWSSYRSNATSETGWLTPHSEYLDLGRTMESRCHAYQMLFVNHSQQQDVKDFRLAAYYSQPVGDSAFRARIEQLYGLKLGKMGRGRPKKTSG